jgi:hypothetical protein
MSILYAIEKGVSNLFFFAEIKDLSTFSRSK